MKALEFEEVAKLVSKSKTTVIDERPRAADQGWLIYDGRNKVPFNEYPFSVVSVQSRATRESLEKAARSAKSAKDLLVVYAPSVSVKPDALRSIFPDARQVLTIREYFTSFIRDELNAYLANLTNQEPEHYIDPRIQLMGGIATKTPNPLYQFLQDPGEWPTVKDGGIAVVLAEAGQGKTYMSQHLASQILRAASGTIPVLIDSSQWLGLSTPELQSVWKTIAHSFEHYSAPLQWINGNEEEFLRVALKADLFRLVFDGFDEYVLRNSKTLRAIDVLQAIGAMIAETGTRVVVTSRASFWAANVPQELLDTIDGAKVLQFEILPFTPDTAKVYFAKRLKTVERINRAANYYARLRQKDSELTGKGFVLSLVADLVEHDDPNIAEDPAPAFRNLLEQLCDREKRRQQLPLSGGEQLDVLTAFAVETATGAAPTSDTLEYCLGNTRVDLDATERARVLEKMGSHALIARKPIGREWAFKQEQTPIVLLGEFLLRADAQQLTTFAVRMKASFTTAQDLAGAIVELGIGARANDPDRLALLRPLVQVFSKGATGEDGRIHGPSAAGAVAAGLVSAMVDRLRGRGSPHLERTAVLKDLAGNLTNLVFRGTVSSYDFRGQTFRGCFFDNITFANCEFDANTQFDACTFFEGASPQFCKEFGAARLSATTELLGEARSWVDNEMIRAGKRAYTRENLKADFIEVLRKFIAPGGLGVRTIKRTGLDRGAISSSRHKEAIFAAFGRFVFSEVKISGVPDGGYVIRDDAKESVKFFAANNVLTGPLKAAFAELQKELAL